MSDDENNPESENEEIAENEDGADMDEGDEECPEEEEEKDDTERQISQIDFALKQIADNNTVPRNIRKNAEEAYKDLHNVKGTPAVRASNAISRLEDVSIDPNCPVHVRTQIYRIVSLLETIRD